MAGLVTYEVHIYRPSVGKKASDWQYETWAYTLKTAKEKAARIRKEKHCRTSITKTQILYVFDENGKQTNK